MFSMLAAAAFWPFSEHVPLVQWGLVWLKCYQKQVLKLQYLLVLRAARAKKAYIHGRVPRFGWKCLPNSACYVKLVACPAWTGCAHFNSLLRHTGGGAWTPQEGFLSFFLFKKIILFFTFTVPLAPSLTGISLVEQGAAVVCSPPDRPHHRLHANCRGVASMRWPCRVKEGRRLEKVVLFSVWWARGP